MDEAAVVTHAMNEAETAASVDPGVANDTNLAQGH
jgi:hypothetical protein